MKERVDLKALLQRVVELVMPNLRGYYRVPRKGRVVKSYASDGSYWADVQPLRNDDSDDANEPVITRIEIPVLWGGPERGVVCPPTVGTLCDITYYDGDPDYPRISNFRWEKNKAPACELGAFIIQQAPGIYVRITAAGNIEHKTSADLVNEIGGAMQETVGGVWNIDVVGKATVTAPEVAVVASTKVSMTTPLLSCSGNIEAGGNVVAAGDVADAGGTKTMSGMRGVFNAHTHQENGTGGGVTDVPAAGM
uniref:Baseplate assembly protein, putative n=1 Tax=Geobacter sp. (strain M21) TaxID=443144 RepID=C6E6P7_GEOSM